MTEKLFKEIMKRSKLRNIFLRNRTEVNKIFYNRQRNYCVSLLWKSKKGYGENQKQSPRCSVKKGVLRNFAKFTGKHLCQRLFFNKVADLSGWLLLENLNINNVTDNKLFWKSVKPLLSAKSRLRYRINISEKGEILTH